MIFITKFTTILRILINYVCHDAFESVPDRIKGQKYPLFIVIDFIINTNNFSIERILPESYFYPGIIFNHKLHLSKDKFQISDGYTITNVDQLNIVNQSEKQPSNVMKNTSIYEFDINKNNWKLYVNTFKI